VCFGFSRPLTPLCGASLEPTEVTEIWFFSFPLTPLLAGQGGGKKKSISLGNSF
jgi:hypothetical protein